VHFVTENIWLVLATLFAGYMLVWPPISRKLSGVRDVGLVEATQLINHQNAVVLDVREEGEFQGGHIPKAKHIPLGALGKRLSELEKHKGRPVVVSCRSGARSSRACGVLRKNGFEQVYNLAGGLIAWEQANMPVEKR
jgi:rhodanese-related sulfurtransferase